MENKVKQLSIIDVVSEYISLRKMGRDYVGLCPFHQDSKPSLNVNEIKGVWHCFVCDAKGNGLTFVSQIEKITNAEAYQNLKNKYGDFTFISNRNGSVKFRNTKNPPIDKMKSEKFKKIIKLTFDYFYIQATNSEEIVLLNKYLKSRGLDFNFVQNQFEFGYAPDNSNIINLFNAHGINLELAFEAGILSKSNGQYFSKYRKRLVLPIYDTKNNLVGITGRDLSDTSNIKYLNSASTEIFKKSETFFGIQTLIQNNSKKIVLTEGPFDCLSLQQINIPAVALMGSSLSDYQINFLKQNFEKIHLCLDNDNAGQIATDKIINDLLAAGVEKSKLFILKFDKKYKDPNELCSYIKANKISNVNTYFTISEINNETKQLQELAIE